MPDQMFFSIHLHTLSIVITSICAPPLSGYAILVSFSISTPREWNFWPGSFLIVMSLSLACLSVKPNLARKFTKMASTVSPRAHSWSCFYADSLGSDGGSWDSTYWLGPHHYIFEWTFLHPRFHQTSELWIDLWPFSCLNAFWNALPSRSASSAGCCLPALPRFAIVD